MIETITAVNHAVNQFIWGVPAMVCIIGVGLLLSVRTGFLQIRKFPYAIKTTIGRMFRNCLLYTSDAADEEDSVDLGGRRNIKKKRKEERH